MKQWFKILCILVLSQNILLSQEMGKGTLSVLVFSDAKPLVGNEIKINGKTLLKTDSDGAIHLALSAGTHKVEIFGKNAQGINLGYFKKQVRIVSGKDTEVIATLSLHAADSIDIDTPTKNMEKETTVVAASGIGTLNGKVLSSQGNKAIAGARVFVRGTSIDIRTDAYGRFSAKVPAGKALSISVVHSAYSAQTVSGIHVKANASTSKTIKLTPASMELEEFVVLSPNIEGSITDILQEEKQLNAIANIIGSEEFSKKGDSSAAGALKRVTGVTLIGGKSIFVRGLGERYSNVELNSMPLPSPDPTKRVVPLDIFPANMIGSMKIQKSGTADIPANFGGGYIDMRTKNKDEDDYIKIGLGIKANINTGKSVISHEGSTTDWTGYDNGYRDIPRNVLAHAEVVPGEALNDFSRADLGDGNTALGEHRLLSMTQNYAYRQYNTFKENLPLGGNFSVEGLKNFTIDTEHKISVFANYTYKQEHVYREEEFFNYLYDINSKPVSLISDGHQAIATSSYSQAAMLNVDYSFSNVFSIKYTKLFTHVGEKRTRETEGIFGSNFDYQYYSYLDWEERTLNADQVSGTFDYELFNHKNTLDFGFEYSTAHLNQPGNFIHQDIRVGTSEENYERLYFAGAQNFLTNKIESTDELAAFYLKNKMDYELFSKDDYLQVGLSHSNKTRESRFQRFYLARNGGHGIDDYTNLPGGNPDALLDQYVRNVNSYDNLPFTIDSIFNASDYFDAEVEQTDMFFNTFTKPYEKVELMMGVKYVNLLQTLFEYQEDRNNNNIITIEENELGINDFFPSLSLKYKYDKENIFDMAFSKTFIVPDLREFNSGSYFHPYDVAFIVGNPELQNTLIYSADFKYGHYFSEETFIKAGLFYKYLEKPIEDTELMSSSLPIFSYMNSDFATLYGLELDARQSLDFFGGDIGKTMHPYLGHLSNYYIAGNLSFTNSEVTLTQEQESLLTTNNRQLQGLSQTVYNVTLGHDSEARSVTFSYNQMGERIRKVGLINPQGVHFGDTMEIPPNIFDFVWIEKFSNGFTGNFKIGNILDGQTVWTRDGKDIRNFRTGQTFDCSLSYKF